MGNVGQQPARAGAQIRIRANSAWIDGNSTLTGFEPASLRVRRLVAADRDLARRLFRMMADVFEEDAVDLSDSYVSSLLARDTFWALVALSGDDVVGGLTAHALPMTRNESSELFIYDLAVRATHQGQGIGRRLVTTLLATAAERGIEEVFVPADTADGHALDFYRALGGIAAPVTIFTFSRSPGEDGAP